MTRLSPGTLFAGRYRIEALLGRGGLSTVYRALDPRLNRFLALKILSPHLANDTEFVQRFQHEVLAAAHLSHPNIVKIFDSGTSEGVPYLAMEYADGGPLQDRLAASPGPLNQQVALAIIEQVGAALSYAHAEGIIHRDIKPSNILIGGDGRALLTDFGLARATAGLAESSLTTAGTILGTPAYMSPEQAMGRPLDPRSDIYSLGVVLYQLLTGRVPFQSDGVTATLQAQVTEQPIPLHDLNPRISRDLEQVVLKALAKDPSWRYQTVQDFMNALRSVADYRPAPKSARESPPAEGLPAAPTSRSTRRMSLWFALIGMLALGIVILTLNGPLNSPFAPSSRTPTAGVSPSPTLTLNPSPSVTLTSTSQFTLTLPAPTSIPTPLPLPAPLPLWGEYREGLPLIILFVLLVMGVGTGFLIKRARRLRTEASLPPDVDASVQGMEIRPGANEVPASSPVAKSTDQARSIITGETLPFRPSEADATAIMRRASDVAAFLVVVNGPKRGCQFTFKGPMATIGRSSENEICLQDPSISRRHARIELQRDRFYVYDLASTNGTFVNGAKLLPPQGQELRDRDEIRLGDINFIFMQVATDISPESRRRLQEFDAIWNDLEGTVHHG